MLGGGGVLISGEQLGRSYIAVEVFSEQLIHGGQHDGGDGGDSEGESVMG